MEFDSAVWGPPLMVLAVSVAFGLWNAMRIVGRDGDPSIGQLTRRIDLESTHDEVLDALRQLELDKDKLEPAVYAKEREELLARGSGSLRALDDEFGKDKSPASTDSPEPGTSDVPAVAPIGPSGRPAPPPPAISPEWRGALYMLLVVSILFVLYNYATQQSVERREGASMTGNQSLGAPQSQAAAFKASPAYQQRLAELTERLKANPNDVEAMNSLTLLHLNTEDPQSALTQNDAALKANPKDTDARTLRAVLTAMMGMPDRALELVDGVLAEDADHTMANMFRAQLLTVQGRSAEAIASLEKAIERNPNNVDLARYLLEVRQAATNGPGGEGAATAGGQVLLSGTLVIEPALASQLKGTETLFLSVADPARPRPPIAADRRSGPFTFPLAFELTTAHIRAMPGAGGVPGALDFKARFDADGNASSVEPGLPQVTVTGVKTGTTGVTVTLGLADTPVPGGAVGGTAAPSGSEGLLGPAKPPTAGGSGSILAAGVATVDPSRAAEITGTEVVFVSVLDPAGGPPLAVARLPAKFPLNFQVTTDNVIQMAGNRSIPENVTLSIRVDKDGSVGTKVGEPEARVPTIQKGATNLTVTLK